MNEIIIDDKKYVSSKQAAEMTGYAKDYVGQLCREGRVPARLIGRSWYVLASAIQDHRFRTEEPKENPKEEKQGAEVITKTWEAPRYESEPQTYFPSINKLASRPLTKEMPQNVEQDPENGQNSIQTMHQAWKDWFASSKENEAEPPTSFEKEEVVEAPIESEEVQIPIHAVQNRVDKTEEPRRVEASTRSAEVEETGVSQTPPSRPNRAIQSLIVVVAFFVAGYGYLALGYADKYVSSSPVLFYITGGMTVNNK